MINDLRQLWKTGRRKGISKAAGLMVLGAWVLDAELIPPLKGVRGMLSEGGSRFKVQGSKFKDKGSDENKR